MKKLLILVLLFSATCKAQEEPTISMALTADISAKIYGGNFYGISLNAGIWAGYDEDWPKIGLMMGLGESKLDDKTLGHRDLFTTVAFRIPIWEHRIQTTLFLSKGLLNDYRDWGIKTGVKFQQGSYIGVFTSRINHYGVSIELSVF